MKYDINKKIQHRDTLYKCAQFLFAIAIAFLSAAITIKTNRISFITADESWLAQILSNRVTYDSFERVPFLSPFLGKLLAMLYRLVPGKPWYAFLIYACEMLCMAVINACVFRQIDRHFTVKAHIASIVISVLLDALVLWTLIRLSAFHVAALSLCAAASLLITQSFDDDNNLLFCFLSLLLFAICVCYMPIVAAALLAVFVLLSLLKLICGFESNQSRRKAIVCAAVVILIMGAGLVASVRLAGQEQNQIFDGANGEWTSLRAEYINAAPRDYKDDSKAFKSIKWSEEFYQLTRSGYFMDERFDADSLRKLLGVGELPSASAWKLLVQPLGGDEASHSRGQVIGTVIMVQGLLLFCISMLLNGRAGRKRLIPVIFIAIATDVGFVLLFLLKSLNFESAFVAGITCVLFMQVGLVEEASGFVKDAAAGFTSLGEFWKKYAKTVLFLVASLAVLRLGYGVYSANTQRFIKESAPVSIVTPEASDRTLVDCITKNKSRLYVCDEGVMTGLSSAVSTAPGELSNLFCWNDAYRDTAPYESQLAANGLKAPLMSSNMADENVWFVSRSVEDIQLLLRYLGSEYGIKTCVVTEKLQTGEYLAKFYKDYDIDQFSDAKDAPLQVYVYEEKETTCYLPVASIEKDKVEWVRSGAFAIDYHRDDSSRIEARRTQVVYGEETETLTYQDLGLTTPGKRFLGWKAYRADTENWLFRDDSGALFWAKSKQDGYNYVLYPNGTTLKQLIPAGGAVHFYAQWENTDRYTVRYFEDDDATTGTAERKKQGSKTPVKTIKELRYGTNSRRFLGWKAYRSDLQRWAVKDKNGELAWVRKVPKKAKYWLFEDGWMVDEDFPAGSELELYAQWEDTDEFLVYYHKNDEAAASSETTRVKHGNLTATLTVQELGFETTGKRFIGWKVYRDDNQQYLVVNSRDEEKWAEKLPYKGTYKLFKSGHSFSSIVPAGAGVHLYAQWEDTNSFTVYYHASDSDPASQKKTEVEYGKVTGTLTHGDLGFYSEGKGFAGWKMYRTSDQCWGVVDVNGNNTWKTEVPKGGSYWLYQDGWSVSTAVPAGYELHLYAQWEDTGEFTVYYHYDDDSKPSELTTVILYGNPTETLTPAELGFMEDYKVFAGWKAYRPDAKKWLVEDGSKTTWARQGSTAQPYKLLEAGATLNKTVPAGFEVHLYGQWLDSFTVFYHLADDMPASEVVTRVRYGMSVNLQGYRDLGFSGEGKRFAGWKVYRQDTQSWLIKDETGRETWAEGIPENGEYCLYKDKALVRDIVEPGVEVHFYAQWEE